MPPDNGTCSFRILGPVQIVAAGTPVGFARRQHLDLVAFLLLHAGRVVTASQIIDAMWGEAAPRTASVQVKNMLSALRGVLHGAGQPLATVDRQPAGYKLHIVSGQLDLSLFTARVAQARAAPCPSDAAPLLRSALDLWEGTVPLAGVRAAFADAARATLREQRDIATEELFDAELASGNHAKIVPALTDAVTDNPGRERLVGQLMLALYRSGRVTDALGIYRRARRVLDEDFGLEPGPELRNLERRILRADPAIEAPDPAPVRARDPVAEPVAPTPDPSVVATPGAPAARPLATPVPAQLPLDVRGFAGRSAELAALDTLVTEVPDRPTAVVVALMGMAGVGKTALAVHWAHRVADWFPDGQLYVDLRGFHPSANPVSPADAVRGFLEAFAVPPERIPVTLEAQVALYRTVLAGRRVLIVLDNALDGEQVRPLLPGTPGCLALVTSRNLLTSLVAAEAAVPMTLDVLSDRDAREFLRRRLGAERMAAEAQAAEAIAARCARLPLALALVGARAAVNPRFPLATLAAELGAARDGPGALPAAGDSVNDVRAAFSWSYQRLAPDAARLFRLLGLYPGPWITAATAASLRGEPVDEVRRPLGELARAHLLIEHLPGQFALHDLLRAYAVELATALEAADRRAALNRLLDYYLHTAYRAALLINPQRFRLELAAPTPGTHLVELADTEAASRWFAAEWKGLVAAVQLAADAELAGHAWQLAAAIATYLDRRGHWLDWVATQRVALAAAERAGDRVGQAHVHTILGKVCRLLKQYGHAHAHLQRAYGLYGELDDRIGQAYIHLRMSALHVDQRNHWTALQDAERALELFQAAGLPVGLAYALNHAGWIHAQLGQYPEAIDYCGRAAAVHRQVGDHEGLAHALGSLGVAHHRLGHHREAVAYLEEALSMVRHAGNRYPEATILTDLANSRAAIGDTEAAHDALRQALDILEQLGHPDAAAVHDQLVKVDGA